MATIKVSELNRLIAESKNEFKPVVGNGAQSKGESESDKLYKEVEKKIGDFDGGLKKPAKKKLYPKPDQNRTTLDFNPAVEPDEEYKKRVKAQAEGYSTDLEKNNGIEKAAEFDDNGAIYKQFTDFSKDYKKRKEEVAHSGLQASKLPKKELNSLFENKTPTEKVLRFKKTDFINEERMMSLIPEAYKTDGQKIHMVDRGGNEYIVETTKSQYTGQLETKVLKYINEAKSMEMMKRIQELTSYSTKATQSRSAVDTEFGRLLNEGRKGIVGKR